MKRILLPALLVLLLLTGCVHRTPFTSEYFYQALGEPGEIVVTADMEKIKSGELGDLVDESVRTNSMVKKTTRVSVSLDTEEIDGAEYYVTSGAVEGDISRFWTNSALFFSPQYEKEKDGNTEWYTQKEGDLSLYVPQNGVLLFSDGDYSSFFSRSYSEREMLIDDSTAELMASSAFSLYVFEPESLSQIGFVLPDAVTAEILQTCLLFNGNDGEIKLSGFINTTTQGTARALNTLFRNQIIQEKRRNGEKLDVSSLSGIFVTSGSSVVITDYTLSGEMKENARNLISERLGGLI